MILQAPTPYVPNRQLTFPTAATNFHLRVPNKRPTRSRHGMGDVQLYPTPYIAPPPQFANVPFSSTVTPIETLESQLQQNVQGLTSGSPASMGLNEQLQGLPVGPAGFQGLIQNIADGQCLENLPDCANKAALVAEYTAILANAYANVPLSQYSSSTFNNGTGAPLPPTPTGPVLSAPVGDAGAYWQTPTTTPVVQTPMTNGAPPVTPPPVINPPATSSNAPNQTTVGSGAGQSNAANPTSAFPDLSSIPNWAWWAAGGVAALMLVSMMGKR